MRSLVHKKKDNRKWGVIGGIALIALMFLSVVGYSFLGNPSSIDNEEAEGIMYNGIEFFESNGYWIAKIGDAQVILGKNPNELNKMNITVDGIEKYYSKPLYIYANENLSTNAPILISSNMQQFSQRIGGGHVLE